MNHIAHFLLAPRNGDAIVGTLLADFHRGPIDDALPVAVQGAIALHRAIDGRTDRHPVTGAARGLFAGRHRRYAGVAMDLYFDHCLVREWVHWADEPFAAFAADTYAHLERGLDASYVPPAMRRMAGAMMAGDWLGGYGQFDGVAAALDRLGHAIRRRFGREVDLTPLADELRRLAPELDAAFAALFPELAHFAVAINAGDRSTPQVAHLSGRGAHRGPAPAASVQPIVFHRAHPA